MFDNSTTILIIVFVIVAGGLQILLEQNRRKGKGGSDEKKYPGYPYRRAPHLLTPTELKFYQVLRAAAGENAVIFAKVRLGDLFNVATNDRSKTYGYRNKIDRKHVDFVLCDPMTLTPIAGVELDDSSHQRDDRQARDEFVDGVFSAAGLPLLHFPARREYNRADLETQITPYVSISRAVAVPTPRCPKCGSTMVQKTARSGTHAGQQFWACSTYPTCKGVISVQSAPN